ncbi:MAG: type CRISPR-associated protein Cas7/Cst2/DevR [Gemmataceae bacterium]|nr:type CRISPR-associated protein Cas7/Cst2/DevR [Gemmataceae bacterium]
MNLFATVLTYPAPSANYRGESELNRTVIQKITDGRFDYPIISPEAMRNALREILAREAYRKEFKTLCNRVRLNDEDQLSVKYAEYPNPDKYTDDFLFGYLVAVGKEDRKTILKEVNRKDFAFKRDSVLRMNLAKALEPYRFNTVFTQSPQFPKENPWKVGSGDKGANSSLLHRETAHTAFQYPFALNGEDCKSKSEWVKALLRAIGELSDVAGNHARSYYEMAPASIVVRLTHRLVAGYQTYGFTPDGKFPEVIDGILHEVPELDPHGKPVMEGEEGKKKPKMKPAPDYTANEFNIGGKIVKDMSEEQARKLAERGVTLDRDPQRLLETVAGKFLGGK